MPGPADHESARVPNTPQDHSLPPESVDADLEIERQLDALLMQMGSPTPEQAPPPAAAAALSTEEPPPAEDDELDAVAPATLSTPAPAAAEADDATAAPAVAPAAGDDGDDLAAQIQQLLDDARGATPTDEPCAPPAAKSAARDERAEPVHEPAPAAAAEADVPIDAIDSMLADAAEEVAGDFETIDQVLSTDAVVESAVAAEADEPAPVVGHAVAADDQAKDMTEEAEVPGDFETPESLLGEPAAPRADSTAAAPSAPPAAGPGRAAAAVAAELDEHAAAPPPRRRPKRARRVSAPGERGPVVRIVVKADHALRVGCGKLNGMIDDTPASRVLVGGLGIITLLNGLVLIVVGVAYRLM